MGLFAGIVQAAVPKRIQTFWKQQRTKRQGATNNNDDDSSNNNNNNNNNNKLLHPQDQIQVISSTTEASSTTNPNHKNNDNHNHNDTPEEGFWWCSSFSSPSKQQRPLPEESQHYLLLPDDPTVQESIECIIFGNHPQQPPPPQFLPAPSVYQQSLRKHRSHNNLPWHENTTALPVWEKHPPIPIMNKSKNNHNNTTHTASSSTSSSSTTTTTTSSICPGCQEIPPPSEWPQAPLLLRPCHGTRIRNVRQLLLLGDDPSSTTTTTNTINNPNNNNNPTSTSSCPYCTTIPINNGTETNCYVADFETDAFEGIFLIRIRGSKGMATDNNNSNSNNSQGYFEGMNRKLQIVIHGKFKQTMPWNDLQYGFQLQRPCRKLPAKWLFKTLMKVLSFFAPQLQIQLDQVPQPYSWTPLGSAPQCLIVHPKNNDDTLSFRIDGKLQEPSEAKYCLSPEYVSTSTSSTTRARHRKRWFDKALQEDDNNNNNKMDLQTQPDTYYTFEFLQHLLNLEDLTIEMGNAIASSTIPLQDILNGQGLPFMARQEKTNAMLWAFELFHEKVYEDYVEHRHGG